MSADRRERDRKRYAEDPVYRERRRELTRKRRADPIYRASERTRQRMRARARRAAARGRDRLIATSIKLSLSGGTDLALLEAMLGNTAAGAPA